MSNAQRREKVAVYCRISNDPAGREAGVDRQRTDCLELAKRLWPEAAVETFVDNDLSAADPRVVRPEWQRLLQAIRLGDIDHVVAYDQSRLTRQPGEWEQLLVTLGVRGIRAIHTVREGERDVVEGPGRMVSRIIAAVDAEYVEATRARVKRAMHQLAVEGRPVGGRSFGHRPAVGPDGRRTKRVVRSEAKVVRWAAEQILVGNTLASVARELNRRGVPQVKKGKGWVPTTVRNMLTNPSVAGLRPDGHGGFRKAIWPPVLPVDVWHRVRACLTRPVTLVRSDGVRYRTTRQRRPARRHLLSAGLSSCGVCGGPLIAQVRRNRTGFEFVSYLCDPRHGGACVGIVGHRLEPFVVSALFEAIKRPEVAGLLVPPGTGDSLARTDLYQGAQATLNEAAARWARGELTRGEWEAIRPPLLERVRTAQTEVDQLGLSTFGDPATLAQRWPTLGLVGQRAVIGAVFESIELHRATPDRKLDNDRVHLRVRTLESLKA